jgi:hypothetical protein
MWSVYVPLIYFGSVSVDFNFVAHKCAPIMSDVDYEVNGNKVSQQEYEEYEEKLAIDVDGYHLTRGGRTKRTNDAVSKKDPNKKYQISVTETVQGKIISKNISKQK